MRRRLRLAPLLIALLASPVLGTGEVQEQTVTPLTPSAEQRVEPLTPPGEQRVEVLEGDGLQQVTEGTKSPARRAADKTAKVAVGVLAAVVSVGVMVGSLLLL